MTPSKCLAVIVVFVCTAPLAAAQDPGQGSGAQPPQAAAAQVAKSDSYSGAFPTRSTLTGDWGGGRAWLEERGVTVKPRLTQFYQGLTSGEGDHGAEYGGKADLLIDADLDKLGLWKGLSLNVHAEYNFGAAVNLRGKTLMPVNTALMFPGLDDRKAFDFSNVTFKQVFSPSVSLLVGKISIIDYCEKKPFMGGLGIDSFWNIVFAAPPSGTVPAYFFGTILSVRTNAATYGVWVYDPVSSVNKAGLDHAFSDGVTIRGSVGFPVSPFGRSGHQALAASYSNRSGKNLESLDDTIVPPVPSGSTKDDRYYAAYSFDQFLYQSRENPKEGVGLFGQFGISEGNPNPLKWQAFGGVGGTGLIPRRSLDRWGVGYYYAAPSTYLQNLPDPYNGIMHEQALEVFYNVALTPWFVVAADVQIVRPSRGTQTAVFAGLRAMIRL
jgi:porin